jgi:hypothetical protein
MKRKSAKLELRHYRSRKYDAGCAFHQYVWGDDHFSLLGLSSRTSFPIVFSFLNTLLGVAFCQLKGSHTNRNIYGEWHVLLPRSLININHFPGLSLFLLYVGFKGGKAFLKINRSSIRFFLPQMETQLYYLCLSGS